MGKKDNTNILKQITNTPTDGLKTVASENITDKFKVLVINKDSGKVYLTDYEQGGGGGIESIVAGDNITIDDTDPLNPIISSVDSSTASNGLTKTSDNTKLGGRTTDAQTLVIVGAPTDNPVGGVAVVWSDATSRPTVDVACYNDDFSFLTGCEVINFNTINRQVVQFGMLNTASVEDLDDTKLMFLNHNGVKSAFLVGMPEDTTANDIVVLDSSSKQIKTISKADLVGYRGTTILSSGTVTVTTDKVKTGYNIYVSYEAFNGTVGSLEAPKASIIDGTSFVINSSTGALDNSTVNWWIAP